MLALSLEILRNKLEIESSKGTKMQRRWNSTCKWIFLTRTTAFSFALQMEEEINAKQIRTFHAFGTRMR